MTIGRFASLALALTACAVPEEDLTVSTQFAWNGGGADCEEWGCGQNSPEIDQLGAHEWRKDFLETPHGFRITKISHDDHPTKSFNIHVKGAAITATSTDGTVNLLFYQVRGLTLHVEHAKGYRYLISVLGHGRVSLFADDNYADDSKPGTLTYRLGWRVDSELDKEWKNVCSKPADGSADNLDMIAADAVVFEGDRIDANTKTVFGYDDAYFNIGCAGHALAKLHLTGYTTAVARLTNGAMRSTPEQKTAMLKMFTADYCGTGTAFTRAGEPLQWTDANGWNRYSSSVALEARWNEHGATCLESPRLSTTTYPTLYDDIWAECGNKKIPTCRYADGNRDPKDLAGKHVASANPTYFVPWSPSAQ